MLLKDYEILCNYPIDSRYSKLFWLFGQTDVMLILEQIQRKVLEWGLRSMAINNFHSLVQNRQHSLLQVIFIGHCLQLVPLFVGRVLNWLFFLLLLGLITVLSSIDFIIPVPLGQLNLLYEVVALKYGAMGLNLDHIYIFALLNRNLLLRLCC